MNEIDNINKQIAELEKQKEKIEKDQKKQTSNNILLICQQLKGKKFPCYGLVGQTDYQDLLLEFFKSSEISVGDFPGVVTNTKNKTDLLNINVKLNEINMNLQFHIQSKIILDSIIPLENRLLH
jgi:hypothetical protein